jgi:ubiquinone/menaquinone biosynthesis C-methylase UbiE
VTIPSSKRSGGTVKPVPSEFDEYATSYKQIIDRLAAITGESFEYFIRLRLGLLESELRRRGEPNPKRVLDFGCGIGATAVAMQERFAGVRIEGVDPSHESIRAAERLGLPGASFHCGDETQLPYDTGSFDLVYSNGTFHHIDHGRHPDILRELVRVLRPGGHLFVFENNPLNPLTVRGMRHNPMDRGTRTLTPWYLRRLERGAGLRVHGVRFYFFFPKALEALRPAERLLRHVPFGAQYYVWGTKD